jgi:DNA-binding PucR family transcriptional regulator
MDPEFEPARAPKARRAWSEILKPLAAELRAGAPELSTAVVTDIRERFPGLLPTEDDFEENRASSEANIAQFAELMEHGREPREAELPGVGIAYVREGARRGVPLAAFLRSLRLGHAAAWKAILAQLEQRSADRDQLAAAADLASAWMFAYVDVLSSFAEETYTQERERWIRTAAALQRDTIDAILGGRDVDVAAASRRLGYELEREHVAIVGWYEAAEEGRDTIAALEAVIGELAGRLGSARPLSEPLGLLAVAAWVGTRSGFDAGALDQVRPDTSVGPGARLALGEPAGGIAGFRDSHRQALHARRVATLAKRPPGTLTRYRRVALSAMATADMEQARAFVERELVGLIGSDDASARLIATLQIFLDEGSSHSRASKRLGIHENTVRYRIKQAEELLGRSVEERTLELRVALALLNVVDGLDEAGASP